MTKKVRKKLAIVLSFREGTPKRAKRVGDPQKPFLSAKKRMMSSCQGHRPLTCSIGGAPKGRHQCGRPWDPPWTFRRIWSPNPSPPARQEERGCDLGIKELIWIGEGPEGAPHLDWVDQIRLGGPFRDPLCPLDPAMSQTDSFVIKLVWGRDPSKSGCKPDPANQTQRCRKLTVL